MYYVLAIETLINESLDENGEVVQHKELVVQENIPEIDPVFPGIPAKERFSKEFLDKTVKSEEEVPLGWWYAGGKFVEPPEPEPELTPLAVIKSEAVVETRLILSRALEVPIDFNGKPFTVTLEKQNLLSAQLGLFGLNAQQGVEMPLMWNATGQVCEPWEFEDLLALTNAIALHVKPLAEAQRKAEVEINEAESEEDVRNIISEYTEGLRNAVDR